MTATPRTPVITRKALLVHPGGEVEEIEVRLCAGRPPLYLGIGRKNWLLREILNGTPRYEAA